MDKRRNHAAPGCRSPPSFWFPPDKTKKDKENEVMGFNYALEKKRFDAEWEKTEKEYIASGMASEAIEEMRCYDWDLFKKRRIASLHEQAMVASRFEDDDSDDTQSALMDKFLNVMSTSDEDSTQHSKHWWIDEIENSKLHTAVFALSESDKDMLYGICFEGFTLKEYAFRIGLPYRTAKYRLSVLKKKIEKSAF